MNFILFALVIQSGFSVLVPSNSKKDLVEEQFANYLLKQNYELENNKNSVAFVNTKIHEASNFLLNYPLVLSQGNPIENLDAVSPVKVVMATFTKFEYAVIFLKRLDDIYKVTANFLKYEILSFSNPTYHFLVLNPQNVSSIFIKQKLRKLWNELRILRFNLLYTDPAGQVQIFSYYPFDDKLSNLSQELSNSNMNFLPKKLTDVKGFKLKISLVLASPGDGLLVNNNTRCAKGNICNVLNCFLKYLNANFELALPDGTNDMAYKDSKRSVVDGKIDISFGTHWLLEEHLMFSSYAIEQSAVAGIVPKAKLLPMLVNFVYIFDGYVWFLVILLKIFFAIFENIFNLLVVVKCEGSKTSLKTILVSSCIFSMVFENAFQGAIITALSSPKFDKDIDTLEDVLQSGLTVYGEDDWANLTSDKLKITYMSYLEVGRHLGSLKADQLYLTTDYWAKSFLLTQTADGTFYSQFYHIVKDALGMGRITYYLRKNSPFRDAFDTFSIMLNDYGLHSNIRIKNMAFKNTAPLRKLSMEHLYGAFLVLACGLCLALLSFLGELFCLKFRQEILIL